MEKHYFTNNGEETESLGRAIGASLKGGEAIQLIGDLGSGKTKFVRGLAFGADSHDAVSSPTFTIGQVYAGKVVIRHFDFYRLQDDEMIRHEINDSAEDQDLIVMEWAQDVSGSLEREILMLSFDYIDENRRQITIKGPGKYGYLLP